MRRAVLFVGHVKLPVVGRGGLYLGPPTPNGLPPQTQSEHLTTTLHMKSEHGRVAVRTFFRAIGC